MNMKKVVTSTIGFYQKYISPATPPSCRYHPTCSTYALQAVEKHGALKGSVMGTARIIRCNPFIKGGVDEVPDYFTVRRNPANINDQYIPEYLMPVDKETTQELEVLLKKYTNQLEVSEQLPSSLETLKQIVDVKELSIQDIKKELLTEELDYLLDIQIIPNLKSTEYKYFTLTDTAKNKKYLGNIEAYDEGIELGKELPLIVLERTGIWYTNAPKLMNAFLMERGITDEDLKNNSYHLWLVLKAIEAETTDSK